MIVAVVGSREFRNRELFNRELAARLQPSDIIISGGARGPDSWAEEYAKQHGHEFHLYEADWNQEGKSAGFKRNRRMAIACDKVLAFWDNRSKGTRHTIEIAHQLGREIIVVFPSGKIKERKRIG